MSLPVVKRTANYQSCSVSHQEEDGNEEEAAAPNATAEAFNFTGGASGGANGGAANNGGAGFNF